jgi:NAD(P)-dependent dehydrogenase (short-subunit alcohol dehydrogenase family)
VNKHNLAKRQHQEEFLMADSNSLEGKVVLVTGGASGIGRAASERLGRAGGQIVLTDIQDALGEAVAKGIKDAGGKAIYLRQDVTNEEGWVSIVGEIRKRFGRLDVLVNNAGIGLGGLVTEMSLETWRKQQAINVEGVFLGVKHSLPLMREGARGGSIINISSVAGLTGAAGMSAYCATKGAVRLFTKAVAMECAAAGDGVRVNSVHPGIIDTPIWDSISDTVDTPQLSAAPGANRLDLNALTSVSTPMARPGVPAEIAEGILYLASDQSSYVTGTELIIDGGMTAR